MQFVFAAESALDESLPGKETARLLNMYPEKGGSRSPITLRSVPGLKETTTLGSGRVRAMISASDGLYAAVAGSLVRWDGTSVTTLGSIPDGDTTFARNRTQIALTAGGKYFVWDGSTLSEITGAAFSNMASVAYLDNFMLISQTNGEAFQYSEVGNAKSLGALDFESAETSPDDLIRIIPVGSLAWMLGASSVEAWRNAGGSDSPFRRISDLRLEKGLRSVMEAVTLDNTFMFVSDEGRAYRQENGLPVIISTDAVAATLKANSNTVALAYQHAGHDFFGLRFGDRPAWVYDAATGAWHERSTGPTHGAWEATATAHHEGTWYAGTEAGKLCTFEGHQDLGQELRREAQSALLSNGGRRFTLNKVDVRLEGAGKLMMQLSRDSQTFGRERIKEFGGSYAERCTFRGLGQAREWSMRLACTDNTEFAIHDVNINA